MNFRTTSAPRSSNLDLLRLVTASAVIFGHAFALNRVAEPGFLGDSVNFLRVKVFFVLSGALLARSWLRDPHLLRYLARRAIRLLPGLALVVLFSAFVLGPIFTTLPLSDYLSHGATRNYLRNIFFHTNYFLPGVFNDLPFKGGINGSLWSLSIEVLMYLMLPVVLWLGQKTCQLRAVTWMVVIGLCAWSVYWAHISPPTKVIMVYGTSVKGIAHLSPFFMIGVLFGLHGWHTRLSPQYALAAVILLAFFTPQKLWLQLLTFALIPYLVLCLGFAKNPAFAWVSGYGDYAYGIYLWGFPVQQLLIKAWGGVMPPLLNFALALPISSVLAILSWHGVEKWFQRFRPEAPTVQEGDNVVRLAGLAVAEEGVEKHSIAINRAP